MPDSREDLLWLLTKLDQIPSRLKHQIADNVLEKLPLSEGFASSLRKMLQHTQETVAVLTQAVDVLFSDL